MSQPQELFTSVEKQIINANDVVVETKVEVENLETQLNNFLDNQVLNIYGLIHTLPYNYEKKGNLAYQKFESALHDLQKERTKLSSIEEASLKKGFQTLILNMALKSDACSYFFSKPQGYAGDYGAMEIIWKARFGLREDEFAGQTKLGKYINAATLNMANCKANQERVHRLQSIIANPAYQTFATIGSGSCIEVEEACKTGALNGKEFHLFDQDESALAFAKEKLSKYDLKLFLHAGNIFKSILKEKNLKFDCVYSSGLFDYLDMQSSQKLAAKLWDWVNPTGKLVIINAHPDNPTRLWMEYIGDWVLAYKTEKELLQLAQELKNVQSIEVTIDNQNVYQYLSVSRNKHLV